MMFDFKNIIRSNILSLEPYRCARDDFKTGILLDANENSHGPALSNLSEEENLVELNRYPDPHQLDLKRQIIEYRNSKPNKYLKSFEENKLMTGNLCLGVGSDESIDMLMRCICNPGKDKILICPPTYGMYSICAKVNDIQFINEPLKYPGFEINIEGILSNIFNDSTIKLVYLTSPGNPTGKLVSVSDVIKLLEIAITKWNGLIVIDEAYIDFTDPDSESTSQSMSTLVNQYPNLVVLQTLSKSFGLAGIRLGITFSSFNLSHYLNSMRYPYNISSLTSNLALRATKKGTGLNTMVENVKSIKNQRSRLLDKLQKIKGIGRNIGGLDANFLLIEIHDKNGDPSNELAYKLYSKLALNNQIIVRFRGMELNCTGCIRISIGTEKENEILVEKIEECLKEIYNEKI